MPHSIWFFDNLKPLLKKYLSEEMIKKTEYLSYEKVDKILQLHFSRKKIMVEPVVYSYVSNVARNVH